MAKVDGNTIEVQAARVRRLTFHLSDRLLDLSIPVRIRVNGQLVHDQALKRSPAIAVEDSALLNDTERFASARVTVDVPDVAAGEKWLATLAPKVEPSRLPFWEEIALTTLKEKRLAFPAEVEAVKESPGLARGQMGLRVKAVSDGSPLRQGDLVVEFDGEPLFSATESPSFLNDYLLRTTGKIVVLQTIRDGKTQRVMLDISMGLP